MGEIIVCTILIQGQTDGDTRDVRVQLYIIDRHSRIRKHTEDVYHYIS